MRVVYRSEFPARTCYAYLLLTMITYASTLHAAPDFLSTFDGDPSTPQRFQHSDWDVSLMTRGRHSWYNVDEGNTAAHGADCSPPPATRFITSLEDTVFTCKHHLMTAMNDDGFGVVTLTPNRMLDLTQETASVSFDVSTLRSGGYDWIEIVLTPYEDNLVHPSFDFFEVAGPPSNALQIALTPGTDNTFTLTKYHNGQAERYVFCSRCDGANFWTAYDTPQLPLIPDAKRREKFVLTITDDDKISFGVVDYHDGITNSESFYWLDSVDVSPLDWSAAVVQFQHFSFNPTNNCGNASCDGDTWHWDNIAIDPAIQFNMIPSAVRYVDPDDSGVGSVQFASPSNATTHLRFSAIGVNMEISTDGGASWQSAQLQKDAEESLNLHGRFRNYFHPVPAGITSVMFRGQNWWGGAWHARDMSFWSPDI